MQRVWGDGFTKCHNIVGKDNKMYDRIFSLISI
jgi:hypothetical protein